MARIGIKLADGSFYPVLETESPQRKRIVLTVAREGQTSAQIDLIREDGDAQQYVGCLVLEELAADTPSELKLTVGLSADGEIDAQVTDSGGDQYQSLSVNLSTLETSESFSLPEDSGDEFGEIGSVDSLEDIEVPEIEDTAEEDLSEIDLGDVLDDAPEMTMPDVALPDDVEGDEGVGSYEDEFPDEGIVEEDAFEDLSPRPFSPLALAAVLLIGVSLVALGAFAVFRWLQTDALPDVRAAAIAPLLLARAPISRAVRRRRI